MKTTLKITAIALLIFVGSTVGATFVDKYINVEDSVQTFYAKSLEDMQVTKFVDGKTTCYIAPTYVNGNRVNTAISCLK